MKHTNKNFGGLAGVEAAELWCELEGSSFGCDTPECGEDRGGGELRGTGPDEDVIDGLNLEKDAGVTDERGRLDVVSAMAEYSANEGAKIGRAIHDEDAVTRLFRQRFECGLAKERQDGFLFGGRGREDGGEQGHIEQFGDEGWRSSKAEIAATLAEIRGVANEQAEARAVEARNTGGIENDPGEFADGGLESRFQGLCLPAEDDTARALEDRDVATEAKFDCKRHGILRTVDPDESQGTTAPRRCNEIAQRFCCSAA